MYFQNDSPAPPDFQHYSCLFSTWLYARPFFGGKDWTLKEAVDAWELCKKEGVIAGDLNGDGDFDDQGEDVILSHGELFKLLKLPLIEVDQSALSLPMGKDRNDVPRVLPFQQRYAMSKYYIAEQWHWKKTHFVAGYGYGAKPVLRDPIRGGSLTVANGWCETLRIAERII